MKPETLDALLIDRALGALSPDVAELLAAYLVQTPAAAEPAAQFTAIVQDAQSVLAVPAGQPLRPIDLRRGSKATGTVRSVGLREGLRLAACVALGAGLMWSAGRWRNEAPRVVIAMAPVAPGAVPAPASKFWSLNALAAARPQSAMADGAVVPRPPLWKRPQAEDQR